VVPDEIEEFMDNDEPTYRVRHRGIDYPIYVSVLPDNMGEGWGACGTCVVRDGERATVGEGGAVLRDQRRQQLEWHVSHGKRRNSGQERT
jgi:hypothetical protein